MKPSHPIFAQVRLLVLAVFLTLASLLYVRPWPCESGCMEPEHAPCPPGSCRYDEQRAGLPLPIVRNNSAGSSPTSGWVKVGLEDTPNPLAFALDVLFFAALLQFFRGSIRIVTTNGSPRSILLLLPQLLVVAFGLLIGFYNERSYAIRNLPITEGPPEAVMIGTWKTAEEPGGENTVLRFYQQRNWRSFSATVDGSSEGVSGEYEWQDEDHIRIFFQWGMQLVGKEYEACQHAPTFLRELCTFTPVPFDPSVYPPPDVQPYSIYQERGSAYPPPPTPTPPQPMGITRIDGTFRVQVEGNQMTLTSPTGEVLNFLRVTDY